MPTEITQVEAPDSNAVILRVSGEMMDGDAEVVERIAASLQDQTNKHVIVDLADLDLLDSEAAPILLRLASRPNISIEGIEVFLQASIDQAEGKTF